APRQRLSAEERYRDRRERERRLAAEARPALRAVYFRLARLAAEARPARLAADFRLARLAAEARPARLAADFRFAVDLARRVARAPPRPGAAPWPSPGSSSASPWTSPGSSSAWPWTSCDLWSGASRSWPE